MLKFDPERLRNFRANQNVTAVDLAKRMGVSPAQIHRLEKGTRRLTVEALIEYCKALEVSVGQLFAPNVWVPITGVIDSDFEIQPIPPDTPDRTLAPPLTADMSNIAAIRWAASRRFEPMRNHIVFYRRHEEGIPEYAWNKRCLVMRKDGSQCLGWPIEKNGSVHIDVGDGPVEFDVDIIWASPAIAVMPPFAIEALQPPN